MSKETMADSERQRIFNTLPQGVNKFLQETVMRGLVAGILPRWAYRLNISEESKSKIKNIRNILDKNIKLNFIDYFNHTCLDDPQIAGHVAWLIDPKKKRHLVAPISYSHTDPERKKTLGKRVMKKISDWCGMDNQRVIQAYQVNNPEYGYTEQEAKKTYDKFFGRTKELRNAEIPTGIIMSPEGHRSAHGILGEDMEVEQGIRTIGKILKPVIYIPVGIIFEDGYKRNSLNFGKEVIINIGETYVLEKGSEKNNDELFELLMQNLANTLPMEMRGKWADVPEIRK